MFRGEFRCKNGLVIPNNITMYGTGIIMDFAFRGREFLEGEFFRVGLCTGVFEPDLQIEDLTEPTPGLNGYVRIELDRTEEDWPEYGDVNGESYVESRELVWEADGGDFDQPINRMFIMYEYTENEEGTFGNVFALSAALPEEFVITPTTDVNDRTFTYRIYGR